MVGYLTLTLFLAAHEGRPREGVIAFTSRSVVVMKHGFLALASLYLLASNSVVYSRGVPSAICILGLVVYNHIAKSCYVAPINVCRTASLTCVLWSCVVSAVLAGYGGGQLISLLGNLVFVILAAGWVIIVLVFWLTHAVIRYRAKNGNVSTLAVQAQGPGEENKERMEEKERSEEASSRKTDDDRTSSMFTDSTPVTTIPLASAAQNVRRISGGSKSLCSNADKELPPIPPGEGRPRGASLPAESLLGAAVLTLESVPSVNQDLPSPKALAIGSRRRANSLGSQRYADILC
jgi:hypothetical protein